MPPSADKIFRQANLAADKLEAIGALVVIGQRIEMRAELTLWDLLGEKVDGQRPSTDGKPISEIVRRLSAVSEQHPDPRIGKLISSWCTATDYIFNCRNSIVHGIAVAFDQGGEFTLLMKGFALRAEQRKREYSDFHATPHTLALLLDAMMICLDAIVALGSFARGEITSLQLTSNAGIKKLPAARSIGAELNDLAAAVNSEKY